MNMNWLASVFERKQDATFCSTPEFKHAFTSFVDALVDSMHAKGPAAPCDFGPDEPPKRIEHVLPAVKRLVAIGDVHGDITKLLVALKAAQLIDGDNKWSGGDAVAVQVSVPPLLAAAAASAGAV